MPQPLRSLDPELRELRHRYNRLFARFTELADTDPALTARTVQELQDLSDRIIAIEGRTEAGPPETTLSETRLPETRLSDTRLPEPGSTDADRPARPPVRDTAAPSKAATAASPRLPESGKSASGIVALQARPTAPDAGISESREGALPLDLDRLRALIERQDAQIAALLRKCDEHRQQLADMERRIIDRHPAKLLVPQIESLGLGLAQQQQRITALAVALQRLLQWLTAERERSKT